MQRSVWAGVGLAVLVALVAMGGWLLARQGDEAFANPGIMVGIDTDPYNTPANIRPETGVQCDNPNDDNGNTLVNDGCPTVGLVAESGAQCGNASNDDPGDDTKVNDGCPGPAPGSIQRCIRKEVGNVFDVDLYIKDVTDLGGWDVTISYTNTIVNPQNVTAAIIPGWFLGTPSIYDAGDADGLMQAYANNFPSGPWYKSESGVLVRISVKAMNNGTSPFNITLNNLDNKNGDSLKLQTTVYNGSIAVGEDCTIGDTDGDGVPDNLDKCPETYHPANTDVDGDGVPWMQPPPGANWGGDACDNSDADGFTDRIELYVGTSYQIACPLTSIANDEADDKWPLDMNDTKSVSSADILIYAGKVSPPTPVSNCPAGANCRLDLNASGVVNSADILLYAGKVSPPTTCT